MKKTKQPKMSGLTVYEQKTALYCELMQTRAGLLTVNELVAIIRVNLNEADPAAAVNGLHRLQEIAANADARRAKKKKGSVLV